MSINVSDVKARKAFKALYKYMEKHDHEEKIETVWLMIATFDEIAKVRSEPKRIILKHGAQVPGAQRCLITEDPQSKYKELLLEKKVKGVHKVIGLTKLRKFHSTKEAKQKLMDDYDMLMADQRLIQKLPQILGLEFYKKRKEPIPVDLTKKDTQKEVLRAVKSTYMNFRKGSQYAVKIATMAQNETQAFENFMGAYEKIVAAVPGGAPNVRSLQIKCAESTSLPVYDAEEDGLVEEEEEETEDEEDQEEQ